MAESGRQFNGAYEGEYLAKVAFPMGGIGAGMLCLEGAGALSHVSLRHRPQVHHEPVIFAAVCVKGEPNVARVLEGPVPTWKVFGREGAGNGYGGKTYGLPRLASASFEARFPFATVRLADARLPLRAELTGWSPFVPCDADRSSLPVAAVEYTFRNDTARRVEAVWSFHARNFLAAGGGGDAVGACDGGFVLCQGGSDEKPWDEGAFSAAVDDPAAAADCAWFRGGWFDSLTVLWRRIASGEAVERAALADGVPSPGGSVFVPFALDAGESRTIRLRLAWYVPQSDVAVHPAAKEGVTAGTPRHEPWYAGRFDGIQAVTDHWRDEYDDLRARSRRFSETFYDTTLPPEVVEAVAANLGILKSPTVLRQKDGRLWCWEGCCDSRGCCPGSCTHVWNYAQAVPHLFADLERTLRETELNENQDDRGHQAFRGHLPIMPVEDHSFFAAADGQLGGILRVYREWRISGRTDWLRGLWPQLAASLDYCIRTWDPDRRGVLREFHHNTYDIEFWGPDGMCGSIYLGALKAAAAMADAVGEDAADYRTLHDKGRAYLEEKLFNGEYFFQDVQWRDLRSDPAEAAKQTWLVEYSPEALELLQREGPKYQYGTGCLADGVLGAWEAAVCGAGEILDADKVRSHALAVYRHNLREDLSEHANPQRPGFGLGGDGGLLVCTWPRGGKPSLPFPYSDEVWTGIEYAVASHLMLLGCVDEGLRIVRAARGRYDGRVRDPFDEYECGHWYARALSSYALIQALTGVRYDAVDKTLYVSPSIEGDFRAFLCTAGGYGTVGVRGGEPFLDVKSGTIDVERIEAVLPPR